MTTKNLDEIFCNLLRMCREHDDAPDWAHGLKLGEECGEVQECILKGNGFLKHKTLKEDVIHEVADVMNTCCALLSSHYPAHLPDELADALADAMVKKGDKYAKVLGATLISDKTTILDAINKQINSIGKFVEEQLGEKCTVSLHSDGSVSVATEVTADKAGLEFGFDTLEELSNQIRSWKRD